MTSRHLAALVGAVAVAVALTRAPAAVAEPNQPEETCNTAGPSSTVCQTPGDVEINDAPPPTTFYSYGGEAGLL
jgi:hypothetical protein